MMVLAATWRCCGDGVPTIPTEYVAYHKLKAKKEKGEEEEKDEEEEEEEENDEEETEEVATGDTGIERTSVV